MPHERLRPSFVFDEERLKQLRQIVPEAFADGKINWDVLKELLGERLEEEGAEAEHFGLFWPGKREARKIASIPSKGALIPAKGEGVNKETTKNILIEGENLEVLKLLQKSYAGKIKMIYIDPPYNTGNDFIYDDNFTEPLEEYLKYTGQMDEEGRLLTTNKRSDGRFHSKWLSMMYPRLSLARNLLRDDGVIFISIDDNEDSNLRKLCDEIFGEENFIGNITWEKRTKSQNTETARDQFQSKTEYIFVYKKLVDKMRFNLEITGEKEYDLTDEKGKYREKLVEEMSSLGMRGRETMIFPIQGVKPREGKQWQIGREQVQLFETRGDIIVKSGKVYLKMRPDDETNEKFAPFWSHFFDKDAYGTAETGKAELSDILETKAHGFETVKPVTLIRKLLFHVSSTNDIKLENNDLILDFFSGSASTAHAVLEINKQDKGKRRFIIVQLPEPCSHDSGTFRAGYKTISEIGKERIRRVIKKLKKESKRDPEEDLGFKVFMLEKSNFKQWQDYKGKDPNELTSLFKEHETPLINGWKSENLLIEVMLQEGFPLDSEIAELKEHKKNAVVQITSEFCEHKLLICFDKKIYQETINALDIQGEDIFVCLDSALSDEQKITLSDKGFLKTI